VVLPLLGIFEKPMPRPVTIEEDFAAHYGEGAAGMRLPGEKAATPAE
jgi:ubiquinol-cytochrome c reductase cytochrome b subunit